METFNVDKSFILEAHKSACTEWKTKLEEQFPNAFPKKLTDRIKNWEDVLEVAGKSENEVLPYRNPKTKNEKSQNAFAKIQLISEVLNDGWTPYFSNTSEYKWYPWFERKSSGWSVFSHAYYAHDCAGFGSGFYFKSEELALFAGKTFLDIYKDYLPS